MYQRPSYPSNGRQHYNGYNGPTYSQPVPGPPLNSHSVPQPSNYELMQPYGGANRFMQTHGLRMYNDADHRQKRDILDAMRNLEWRRRVDAARASYRPSYAGCYTPWADSVASSQNYGRPPSRTGNSGYYGGAGYMQRAPSVAGASQGEYGGARQSLRSGSVLGPSNYEIEKDWGGTKRFMESHDLDFYDWEDWKERDAILDKYRDLNASRDHYDEDTNRSACGSRYAESTYERGSAITARDDRSMYSSYSSATDRPQSSARRDDDDSEDEYDEEYVISMPSVYGVTEGDPSETADDEENASSVTEGRDDDQSEDGGDWDDGEAVDGDCEDDYDDGYEYDYEIGDDGYEEYNYEED